MRKAFPPAVQPCQNSRVKFPALPMLATTKKRKKEKLGRLSRSDHILPLCTLPSRTPPFPSLNLRLDPGLEESVPELRPVPVPRTKLTFQTLSSWRSILSAVKLHLFPEEIKVASRNPQITPLTQEQHLRTNRIRSLPRTPQQS